MIRFLSIVFLLMLLPPWAWAADAPSGQVAISNAQVLRGHFTEDRQMGGMSAPLHSTGRFVVSPARGLLWSIERPMQTSTIITSKGIAQDIGGIALKLPSKNLHHLYNMVGSALAGDWSGLETDFILSSSGTAGHWQMLLTPKNADKPKLSYSSISVTGSRFVETIVLTKSDGTTDTFLFTDSILSSAPLSDQEIALFNEVS